MNEDDASILLLRTAHLDVSNQAYLREARDIVADLGCLALAIDQAGAYIFNDGCNIHDYRATFEAHHQELLREDSWKGAGDYDLAAYASWDLSRKAIKRMAMTQPDNPQARSGRAALEMLHMFAFLHHEGISETMFKAAAENEKAHIHFHSKDDEKFPSPFSALIRMKIGILIIFILVLGSFSLSRSSTRMALLRAIQCVRWLTLGHSINCSPRREISTQSTLQTY